MKADQEAKDEGATPIGECYIPYKLCFLAENINQWLDYRCVLSDRKGLAYKMVTGQLSARVRFVELGTENSSFNYDGTKKDKRAVVEDFFKNKVEQMINLQRSATNNKVEETQPAESQVIEVAEIPIAEDGFDEQNKWSAQLDEVQDKEDGQQDLLDEENLTARQGYDPEDQLQIKDDIESDQRGFDEEPDDADFQISQTLPKLDDQI